MHAAQDIATLTARLAGGRTSSRDLTEACLERALDPSGEGARVFISVSAERARAAADAADDHRRSEGQVAGPLVGIPISVKDVFDIAGERTLAGSKVLSDAPAATSDAVVVRRLRAAGAILIGRTNMSEFAFSGVGHNPHYGTPGNPWDRSLVPGGSSSGAAVSVSDGMAHGAVGSDTGGSVRVPAALCGLAGFKPTKARVSTRGMLPLSTTLDSVGPIARSVADCRLLDSIMAGETPDGRARIPPAGVRFGVPQTLVLDDLDENVSAAFERTLDILSRRGAIIEDIQLSLLADVPLANAGGGFPPADAFAWHEDLLSAAGFAYDPRARARFESGRSIRAADYIRLCWKRAELIEAAAATMGAYDALLTPTCPIRAPAISAIESDDACFGLANRLLVRNTTLVNFLDCCAATLPIQVPSEAPVGLMIIGRAFDDHRLLAIAEGIEHALRRLFAH
jgi:aspartyl-tRNA(Asn)/glutamyl-tRNA(Gln) amidotransferase subunit A